MKENDRLNRPLRNEIEQPSLQRIEQSIVEMNSIRKGEKKGKSWKHLKNELNKISSQADHLTGENGMIKLDPSKQSHVEWFNDDSCGIDKEEK